MGGELSGATTCATRGLDHSSSQGWVLEAPGRRVPLPLPSNQVFGGGDPKAILERAPGEGPTWAPTRLAAPFLHPRLPQEAQSYSGQALLACHCLLSTSLIPFSGPVFVTLALGFISRLEVSKRPSRAVTAGTSVMGSCGPCASSLSGRPQSWAEGPGAGPRVQPSSYSFPSLNSINMSTPLLWE